MYTIKKQTIATQSGYRTISWLNNSIIDWAGGGTCYGLNGEYSQLGAYHYAYDFDRGITSADGRHAFIYHNRGTKGLLLKDGDILREINRSYYHASTYEYPAAFYTAGNGTTYLIHCPIEYCRLDFEEVETGKIVTDVPERAPVDIFHSRLSLSPDNKFLMVRGWAWHPLDLVRLYDIEACLSDPKLLDMGIYTDSGPIEQSIGCFINSDEVLLGSLDFDDEEEGFPLDHIASWNFKTGAISKPVKVSERFGNIVGVYNGIIAWDFSGYPKIIDIRTGSVIDKMEDVSTGNQVSSIIHHIDSVPQIIFNPGLNAVAVASSQNTIDVFSLERFNE